MTTSGVISVALLVALAACGPGAVSEQSNSSGGASGGVGEASVSSEDAGGSLSGDMSCSEEYDGDLLVDATTNLDAVRSVRRISGSLTLTSLPGHDLAFLNCLEEVEGALFILDNESLETLEGMGSLMTVDAIFLENNRRLRSLSGLTALTQATRGIKVMNNSELSDFSMPSLQVIGGDGLILGGCISLSSEEAESVGDNNSLESINGLDSLVSVNGLLIAGQENLRSLEHLEGLARQGTDFGGYLSVRVTPRLALAEIQSFAEASGATVVQTCQNKDNPEICNCPAD